MKKLIYIISAVLLLIFASGASAGDCLEDVDFSDCKVKAEQGDAGAQYILGLMYAEGKGVPQDDKKAVLWFSQAAEQGVALAQTHLGNRYANGEGVPQDDKKAVEWYSKAAEQGIAGAQVGLWFLYVLGKGVLQDYVMAHMFWNIAGANGDKDGAKYRDKVAKMMTASQIQEAQRLARKWMQKNQ